MEPALGRAEVSEFSVDAVSQPFVRFCVDYYWLPVLISCLLLFWVSRPNEPTSSDEKLLSYLEISFYPAILVGAALTKRLLRDKIPSTVAELCQTGPLSDDVARTFPRDLQQHLNSFWAESLGIGGGISIVCFYFGPGGFAGNWGPNQSVDIANVMIMCIDALWGYLIGIAMWKVIATALDIARLARRGQLRVHPFHPDRCGGLSAIGRLYFPLALILISTGFFLSGWIYYAHWINPRFYRTVFYTVEPSFSAGLLVLIVFSILAFVGPMIPVHRAMKDEARRSTVILATLGQRISECEDLVLAGSSAASLEVLDDQYTKLESLQNRYRERRRIPTWPVDVSTSLKFWIGQLPVFVAFGISSLTLIEKIGALGRRVR